MNYYIDGDFNLPEGISSSENTLYSSTYSSNNSNYISIGLEPEAQNQIYKNTFSEVVNFYNKHEKIFTDFEKKSGINLWFFEQFRLYFSYRSFALKVACIKAFKNENKTGIIISSDERLKDFINEKNIQLISTTSDSTNLRPSPVKEILFMLRHIRWRYKQNRKHLIVSRIEDDVNGTDQRFGGMEKDFDKILNRDIFNGLKTLPDKKTIYTDLPNVDGLFIKNLLKIDTLMSFWKFKKLIDLLFKDLNHAQQNTNANERIINKLFQKNKLSFYVYFLKYKSFVRLFKRTNYNSVVFINENSAQQKAIQYAALQQNVKVYAVQHGAIYDLHPAYIFGKYNTPPVLPTITFTWGTYFTNLLQEKGGYRPDQVKTSGRLTPTNLKAQKHEALSTVKKIIVYATQPQPNKALRIEELKDVLIAIEKLKEKYLLVIRPHPAEKENSFFEDIATEIGCSNFVIDRISDLKTHFESAAIVITSYSTVGAEFIPYYKPLLVLDYLKTDTVNYIKQGVGIPIYSKKDLIDTLKRDSIEIDRKAFEIFVDNYFYEKGEKAIDIIRNEIEGK